MKHLSYKVNDIDYLNDLLNSPALVTNARRASAILVQIYSARNDEGWYQSLASAISPKFPGAVIVGTSTFGEIISGHTTTGQTIVGFSFFNTSHIDAIGYACETGKEKKVGEKIKQDIKALKKKVAGVLLLATPLSIQVADFIEGFQTSGNKFPVFGGGAGDYAEMSVSQISLGQTCFSAGVITVIFSGDELFIETFNYLGWRMISKEMVITDVDGMLIKTVDGKPAFDIYAHYLGIKNDPHFFMNALAFPLMVKRKKAILARTPFGAREDGAIQLVADIHKGETIRIGYGDTESIRRDGNHLIRQMSDFDPQAVFLFSCCCRRFLMQDDVELETLPFEGIAPAFGFYTYCEFNGNSSSIQLMNSTLVAVGVREGPARSDFLSYEKGLFLEESLGKNFSDENSVSTRLVHFLGAVTRELEVANRELLKLSSTDSLTQINNRGSLDTVLQKEITDATRSGRNFSIILMDVDHFKQINDTLGHIYGDQLLENIARVLRETTRKSDFVGRWGGDEFLIILPDTVQDDAVKVAGKLLENITAMNLPEIGPVSSSLGVTGFKSTDNEKSMVARADEALYLAKSSGRNQVCQK
jgi:diguanylate cyclase (GGDEF)-like protein